MKQFLDVKRGLWILKSTDPVSIEELPYYEFEDYKEWLIEELKRRKEEKEKEGKNSTTKPSYDKYIKGAAKNFKQPKMPKINVPKF